MEIRLGATVRGPLDGIRVLDLTAVVSGPLCTQILGDLGADVIKLETHGGDVSRVMGLPQTARISPLFAQVNRNKRSLALDLKTDEGREIARRLASRADVLVENFRPGVADRLGLGYEALDALNEKLVYVSINGFGPDGPYAELPAYDTGIQGLTGFMPVQGGDGEPRLVQCIAADKTSALTAAYAVMGALLARERGDGRGQRVHVPMLDAYAAFMLPDILGPDTFPGSGAPAMPPVHRTWQTADGHVVIMVVENDQFFGMCRVLDREDLIDDPRCKDLMTRISHGVELFREMGAEIRKWPTAELVERARRFGAPVAPANRVEDFFADPQVVHNRTVVESDHDAELGPVRYLRQPVRYERTPADMRRLPPRLGEHSDELLAEAGFDAAEIGKLRERGVVV